MNRTDQILRLADRLEELVGEARALGIRFTPALHGLDRETFDQLPGEAHVLAGSDAWFKQPLSVTFWTHGPPANALQQEIERLEARAQELRKKLEAQS